MQPSNKNSQWCGLVILGLAEKNVEDRISLYLTIHGQNLKGAAFSGIPGVIRLAVIKVFWSSNVKSPDRHLQYETTDIGPGTLYLASFRLSLFSCGVF